MSSEIDDFKKESMTTIHKIFYKNSSKMSELEDNSIDLVVTSPPYPMIEMWDELFFSINSKIKDAIEGNELLLAYSLMHEELDRTWAEINRVIKPGGIICINIGDATRKIGDTFQLFPNHATIINFFQFLGYQILPCVIWRKQTNKPNKFMGSGMLPPNAYVTLEHEYILIFRKTGNREFLPNQVHNRRASSYFWEERNIWFSDVWFDLLGTTQKISNNGTRDRSAAFPFDLAYRLINMYSVYNDTVLDPFLGTGTTTIAAMCTGRNSFGYEINQNFTGIIKDKITDIIELSRNIVKTRLNSHIQFIKGREAQNKDIKHKSLIYGFPVITSQEIEIFIPVVEKVEEINDSFRIKYSTEGRKFINNQVILQF